MIIDNNYLSGICDEANLDPSWITSMDLDEEHECLAITLPAWDSLLILASAFRDVVGDTALLNALMSEYETYESMDDPRVTLYWPGIECPDWKYRGGKYAPVSA